MGEAGMISLKYSYGFQGQEKDDEVKGEGNSLNYKFRMQDPRIGRFFAIDPLADKYPHYTPYQFSGNKVIHCVELEGLEENPINAGVEVGISYKFGTAQTRLGLTIGGYAGIGSTELNGSLSLFGNNQTFGQNGSSFEGQLTLGLTQGMGPLQESNEPHDFSINANNTGRTGSLSLYSTTYFGSINSKQRVAGFGFNIGDFKLAIEDDYLPFVSSTEKYSLPLTGDGFDRYRTAAVHSEFKVNSDLTLVAGFKLFTSDPKIFGLSDAKPPEGFNSMYNSIGPISRGIAYFGTRSGNQTALVGVDAEAIRHGIIKGVHKVIKSPYQPWCQNAPPPVIMTEVSTTSGVTCY